MLYLPCIIAATMSLLFHVGLLFVNIFSDELDEKVNKQWILATEGFLDDLV